MVWKRIWALVTSQGRVRQTVPGFSPASGGLLEIFDVLWFVKRTSIFTFNFTLNIHMLWAVYSIDEFGLFKGQQSYCVSAHPNDFIFNYPYRVHL